MDEIFKNTAYRIFELFLEQPRKLFSIRAIARELGITHATVARYITDLHNIGLVSKTKATYTVYKANTHNEQFKEYNRIKSLFEYNKQPPSHPRKRQKGYIL